MVDAIKTDYTQAKINPATKALLDASVKLTRKPWEICQQDFDSLHDAGLTDEAIHDGFQVAAYFNYINRIADGFGVELEEEMPEEATDWKQDCPYR